jgi:hypothetical protein
MIDPVPTLNHAPARHTNRLGRRLLNCGTVLLILCLVLIAMLPSGPLKGGWRVAFWGAVVCTVAGFALDIAGFICLTRTKRP